MRLSDRNRCDLSDAPVPLLTLQYVMLLRTGQSCPDVALPILNKGEGQFPSTGQ